ncbi:MAG TPA: xanthine dehydrogenase family protein subunit M [Hyphomicrobiaceae bacterium]|nr:xanthine dehydrogenase family protein subunit M [Hyphomicrobiaceae bacterium]
MYAFNYQRPKSLQEAAQILAATAGAKILAGGQTLLPTMKQRLAQPECLIDLAALAELQRIALSGHALTIGAMVTHAMVAESADVKRVLPGLAAVAEGIGDPHVRNCGTIGGSLANNDPAADYPAAVLALGATVETSKRTIAADDFFKGLFTTALQSDEIVTQVSFPLPAKFAYAKFPNPASRYALVGVAVAQRGGEVRVAVTGAGSSGVFRVPAMETALKANFSAKALDGISVSPVNLATDLHADAAYRAHLIGVMAKRAVVALA